MNTDKVMVIFSLLRKRTSSIELTEMNSNNQAAAQKTQQAEIGETPICSIELQKNTATSKQEKLIILRQEFVDSGKKKPIIAQEFTTEEVQQLFKTEWAYPENSSDHDE